MEAIEGMGAIEDMGAIEVIGIGIICVDGADA
jgi:hypothetical protein